MSVATWIKEFVPNNDFVNMTWLEAIDASILKWNGVKPENLSKHNVVHSGYSIKNHDDFRFYHLSECPLCDLSNKEMKAQQTHGEYREYCTICPLFKANGRVSCDEGGENSIWNKTYNKNLIPMFDILEKTKIYIEEEMS